MHRLYVQYRIIIRKSVKKCKGQCKGFTVDNVLNNVKDIQRSEVTICYINNILMLKSGFMIHHKAPKSCVCQLSYESKSLRHLICLNVILVVSTIN